MFNIRKVVLHKNGLAYFERAGTVTGTQTITLEFQATDMDDVLRSLRVVDESGGRVESIAYDSSRLINAVGRSPIFIPFDNSMSFVLASMQGTNVRLTSYEGSNVTGRILGITTKNIDKGDPVQIIDILSTNQLVSLKKDDIASITILDEHLPSSLSAFLDYAAAKGNRATRKVTVTCAGEGKRTVYFSYVIKHSVWKSNYRLNMKTIKESGSNNNSSPAEIDECTIE